MAWKLNETHDPSYSVFTGSITQLDGDKRQLRLIRLHNGMQVLLVQDTVTPKAAACLTVRVGDLQDPVDIPGLAHFLEHILTHGSEQYPEPHSFQTYLSECRGNSTKLTSPEDTTYSYSVENHALIGLLERLASFLCQPLFGDRAIHQEVQCVESEFQNYLLDDSWRLYDLDRHLSKAGDSWGRFGIGNWSTLAHTGVQGNVHDTEEDGTRTWIKFLRDRLRMWYDENYCATRMNLVIIGAASLDDLTAMAVLPFSSVPHHHPTSSLVSPKFDSPWGADQEGTVVLAKTVQDTQQIEVRWIVPTQTLLYRVKPLGFLSYFLHRKCSGSLYEILSSRGWITSLHASKFGGDPQCGFQSFYIHITVTATGWRNWEEIVVTVHKYIALVRDLVESDPEFATSVQSDICSLSEVNFRYREPSMPEDEAKLLGEAMSKSYPPRDIITGYYLTQGWGVSVVSENLVFLTPDKARVTLSGRDGWEDISVHGQSIQQDPSTWDRAPWYNTEYKVLRLVSPNCPPYTPDDARMAGLQLRRAHSYSPENLEVVGGKVEGIEPNPRPHKIHDTPSAELWYKMDDQFGVPKTSVVIKIVSTVPETTPRYHLFTLILNRLINDALADDFNDAALGLLDCCFHCDDTGILVMVYGFSDRVPVILGVICEKVLKFVVTPENLRTELEELRKELEDEFPAAPVDLAEGTLDYLLLKYSWTGSELLAQLDAVNTSSIQHHLSALLDRVYIRVLVNGNAKEEDALNILKIVEESLGRGPSNGLEPLSEFGRDLCLPEGCNFVHEQPVPNPQEKNSGLAFHCQVGDETSVTLRAGLAFLVRVIQTPFFNRLQVEEQLGYKVGIEIHSNKRTLSMRVLIQGTHDPAFLEQRVELGLESMRRHIEQLTQDDLEKIKTAHMKSLRRAPANIQKEAYRFWDRIVTGHHDFTRRETEAKAVECLTKDCLLRFFDKYICPGSLTRSKVSVWFKSAQYDRALNKPAMTSGAFIQDALGFKISLHPNRLPASTCAV